MLAVIYLLTVVVLYLYPFSDALSLNRHQLATFRGDHIMHLLVFFPIPLIATPLFTIQKRYRLIKVAAFSFIIAVIFELSHLLVPYRSYTPADLLANLLGVMAGFIIVLTWSLIKKR